MEPRDHQRLVDVWKPGGGIAVHNVKYGVFQLFICFFPNRIHKAVDIHVKSNRQPADKGPLARGGALSPSLSIVSEHSTLQAELLALLR